MVWYASRRGGEVLHRDLQEFSDRQYDPVRGSRAWSPRQTGGNGHHRGFFELEGQAFTALNGGPVFTFNEAISFQIGCKTQEEVDYYWEKLSEGGDAKAQQWGWLKDKYGVSWQVVPTVLAEMLQDADAEKSQRVMKAMLQMKKMDIETLKRAYEG
jgi:predicted 3-demethylubiquinone-9 3-methyltransferase (glyoxalase superfamily)